MKFKSAFWQIELDESSRYLSVFHVTINYLDTNALQRESSEHKGP